MHLYCLVIVSKIVFVLFMPYVGTVGSWLNFVKQQFGNEDKDENTLYWAWRLGLYIWIRKFNSSEMFKVYLVKYVEYHIIIDNPAVKTTAFLSCRTFNTFINSTAPIQKVLATYLKLDIWEAVDSGYVNLKVILYIVFTQKCGLMH